MIKDPVKLLIHIDREVRDLFKANCKRHKRWMGEVLRKKAKECAEAEVQARIDETPPKFSDKVKE